MARGAAWVPAGGPRPRGRRSPRRAPRV